MAFRGSFSSSLISTARSSLLSSRSAVSRRAPLLLRRRLCSSPRSLSELGYVQSLLPLHSVVAKPRLTSHMSVSARACCELSHGTFCRTCQDR